jgi:hypothetical protein
VRGISGHQHHAADVTSGTLNGDRLPPIAPDTHGGVPATGTPSGKILKDDGTWGAGGSGTTDHAALTNKDYASSGHTGFVPDTDSRLTDDRTPTSHGNTKHSTAFAADSDLTTHTGYTTTAHGGLLPATAFSGLAKITISATAPVGPGTGDLWVDVS